MKQSENKMTNMPKTLYGFYAKYVWRKMYWLIIALVFARFMVGMDNILWPMYQRWIVAMFEDVPAGVNLMKWCLPTIGLIFALDLLFNIFWTVSKWLIAILRPRASRQISETLTDYVHTQSMSF